MSSSEVARRPVRLLKNRRYPTYQLYAITSSKKAPETVLVIAVLQTMQWLRERFRDFEIPAEINMPDADDFESVTLDALKSFHIYDGYKVEAVWLLKEKNWTLQLTEPDLGPKPGEIIPERLPVPGRLIETNIAYRITGDHVECAFRTVVAEPDGINAPCEIFRLSVIKYLARNPLVGLEQCFPLIDEPIAADTSFKVRRLADWLRNEARMLPAIIAVETETKPDLPSLEELASSQKLLPVLPPIVQKNLKPERKYLSDIAALARYRMGFAQYFKLPCDQIEAFSKASGLKPENGDLILWEPAAFGGHVKTISASRQTREPGQVAAETDSFAMNYPKDKPCVFGNSLFLPESRQLESVHILELSESKAELLSAFASKEGALKEQHRDALLSKDEQLALAEEKNGRQKEYMSELRSEKAQISEECERITEKLNKTIAEKETEIEWLRSLDCRPELPCEVSEWIEERFAGKLIFHQKAKDLISSVEPGDVDIRMLCDALDFLATDYRSSLLGEIADDELGLRCSKKYGRPFEVVPLTGLSIDAYPSEYKIKYYIGYTGKPVESPLDLHLRVGVSSENLIRIYFLYDKEKKLIVVGSLPKHLKTLSYK